MVLRADKPLAGARPSVSSDERREPIPGSQTQRQMLQIGIELSSRDRRWAKSDCTAQAAIVTGAGVAETCRCSVQPISVQYDRGHLYSTGHLSPYEQDRQNSSAVHRVGQA